MQLRIVDRQFIQGLHYEENTADGNFVLGHEFKNANEDDENDLVGLEQTALDEI